MITKDRFREALIHHVAASGISVAELARRTGVAKSQLDKLMQRRVVTTNVIDATVLAHFFGKNVEDFLGIGSKEIEVNPVQVRIRDLVSKLSPSEQELIVAQLEGIVARKQRST